MVSRLTDRPDDAESPLTINRQNRLLLDSALEKTDNSNIAHCNLALHRWLYWTAFEQLWCWQAGFEIF